MKLRELKALMNSIDDTSDVLDKEAIADAGEECNYADAIGYWDGEGQFIDLNDLVTDELFDTTK